MKILIALVLFLIALAIVLSIKSRDIKTDNSISINGKTILIEIADTAEKRRQGLSDRNSLAEDVGLLFIFPTSDIHPFWNYHLKFPIDVLWIDNGIIKEIGSLPIETNQPVTYTPKEKANYVLEVNQGLVEKYQWRVGDSATIKVTKKP